MIFGSVILVAIICKFSKPKCLNCEKRNAEKINSIEVDRYQSTKRVTDETKNRNGDVVRTTGREIPITIACYKETYKCNECGTIFTKIRKHEL